MFFRVRGYCILLTKIEAMSLCLFWLFKEMLSMQFYWNTQRRTNYPRAILEFEISHQMFMMTQNIISNQNLFKHLRWSSLGQAVNGLKSNWAHKIELTGHTKRFILDVWRGSEYAFALKQGRCKVCKRNSQHCKLKCKCTLYMFWNVSMIVGVIHKWRPLRGRWCGGGRGGGVR